MRDIVGPLEAGTGATYRFRRVSAARGGRLRKLIKLTTKSTIVDYGRRAPKLENLGRSLLRRRGGSDPSAPRRTDEAIRRSSVGTLRKEEKGHELRGNLAQ